MFGAALVVLYLVFWAWHSPWVGKLTKAEIDRYLAITEKRVFEAVVRPFLRSNGTL